MFLLKTIQKSIEKCVLEYVRTISEKYNIPEDDLVEMWGEVTKMRIKTASNQSKRMSPWLRFCKEERVRMKTSDPELSFGEISKRIGEKWSSMSTDDREAYIASLPTASNNTPSSSAKASTTNPSSTSNKAPSSPSSKTKKKGKTTAPVHKEKTVAQEDVDPSLWTKENLEKMKIDELRELCSNVQLSKSGKKSDLVDRLLKSIQYSSNLETGEWSKVSPASPSIPQEEDETGSVSSEFQYEYASDS